MNCFWFWIVSVYHSTTMSFVFDFDLFVFHLCVHYHLSFPIQMTGLYPYPYYLPSKSRHQNVSQFFYSVIWSSQRNPVDRIVWWLLVLNWSINLMFCLLISENLLFCGPIVQMIHLPVWMCSAQCLSTWSYFHSRQATSKKPFILHMAQQLKLFLSLSLFANTFWYSLFLKMCIFLFSVLDFWNRQS